MGEKRIELMCPQCGRKGEAVVDDGQSFTVEQLLSDRAGPGLCCARREDAQRDLW